MSHADPGIIVRRDSAEFAEWLRTESGFLEGLASFEGKPLVLEPFQRTFLDFFNENGQRPRFRWVNKARQIGFSFLIGLEALARCHLKDHHNAIFVSYNLEDAKEKVRTARAVYEDLPLAFQKKLVVDSKTELGFEARSGSRGAVSRIISNPSRAPRGKNGDIYLDEIAHYILDREIYRGSMALILRGKDQITGCSTPLGKRGIFWEVMREEVRPYPNYARFEIPWWMCSFFCTDVWTAMREAPQMTTHERVERFGTGDIQDQLSNMALDDFQQEFECLFVDESTSFYPYDLILPCTSDTMSVASDPSDLDPKKIKSKLVGGYDVGRTADRSEMAFFERVGGRMVCRLLRSFEKTPFRAQEAEIERALKHLPVSRFRIDQTGMGRNLAENLAEKYPCVEPVDFTMRAKERMAVALKIAMQSKGILLPADRNLVSQIHSIRRRITNSGNVVFDSERNAQGHADKFWAVALALYDEKQAAKATGGRVNVRVLG